MKPLTLFYCFALLWIAIGIISCASSKWNGIRTCELQAWTGGDYQVEEVDYSGLVDTAKVLHQTFQITERWMQQESVNGKKIFRLVPAAEVRQYIDPSSDIPISTIKRVTELNTADEPVDVQCICKKQRSEALVRALQSRLQSRGYYWGHVSGEWDDNTRYAMLMYQRANGLPQWQLSTATLESLDIDPHSLSSK